MSSQKKQRGLRRLLVEEAGKLRQEAVTELLGNRRVCVQGVCDILHFTPEEVSVRTLSGTLRICGDTLVVCSLTQDSIEVRGVIHMVILSGSGMGETM